MLDNAWVRLANNWLHDVASGLWAACLLVLWLLEQQRPLFTGLDVEAWHAMAHVSQVMFQVLLGALVVIVVTGVLRLLYWRRQTPAEEMPRKRRALVGKHVAFVLVYGAGTVLAWTLVWPR